MFAVFMEGDEKAVNVNIRKAMFSIALEHGGEKEVSSPHFPRLNLRF
jgi:aminopeptidase 2